MFDSMPEEHAKNCINKQLEVPVRAVPRLQVLVERENTHGDFLLTSKIAQDIKEAIRWAPKEMSPLHREVLEMIATKIARICIGNANEVDHWKDIIGYATLALERIKT